MQHVCILHIGKTGGTALKAVIASHKQIQPNAPIETFDHSYSIERVCSEFPNSKIIFFVREPLNRFISGFNSRQRHGRPRHDSPWSEDERLAFERFSSPNSLGEALSSCNFDEKAAAEAAMAAISHLRMDYRHYLKSERLLETLADRILFIGDQADYNDDVERIKMLLEIDPTIVLPLDDVAAHRSPASQSRALSPLAEQNLRSRFEADYAIYNWCIARRALQRGVLGLM